MLFEHLTTRGGRGGSLPTSLGGGNITSSIGGIVLLSGDRGNRLPGTFQLACVLRVSSCPLLPLPRCSSSVPLLCASCASPSDSKVLAIFAAFSLTSLLEQPGRYRRRSVGCFQGASSSGSPCCVQVRLLAKTCLQLSRFAARVLPRNLPCAAAPARGIARYACAETPRLKRIFSRGHACLCAECSRRGCRRWCLQQRH